jgi:hypothetical protein
MKRALLIVALLIAWAPAVAFADYDARKSEAMSDLEKAEMTTEERAALKTALESYFRGREDCLEQLVAIVAKKDESAQHPAFRDRAGVCNVGSTQILSRGLGDIKEPSKGALEFLNVFTGNETAFFQSLGGVLVTESRDLIVVIRLNLSDMTEALEEKWKVILDEDKTLDQHAKQHAADIRSDLDAVIKEAAESHKDAAELIAEGVKKYASSPTAPTIKTGKEIIDGIISLVKGALVPAIDYWQNTNLRAQTRVRAYKSLFSSERRVLVMFEEVRDDVKEFLEDNDYPVAEAAFAKGKSSVDSFVSSAKTSGQSSDASELRDDLMAQLTGHLKEAADVYGKFVGKHKEKFFGALGPSIKEELVEHDAWEDYADALAGYSLDAKLRTWQDDATNYFAVDLSPLPNDAREDLKAGLRAIIDNLVAELKATGQTYRDVKNVIEEEREDVEEELK